MSHTQSMKARGESTAALSMVNIDSADPARLARFYAAALGWEVTCRDDSYGMVEGNGIKIGFGKVEGFRPAQWPDEAGAKRFHLDLQATTSTRPQRGCARSEQANLTSNPELDAGGCCSIRTASRFCLSPRPAAVP